MASHVVLVHGAWHGGWVWAETAARLRRNGHTVHVPDVTDMASPAAAADRVCEAMAGLDAVVLVGHSLGGMAVTVVADRVPERVRALIYVDAFVPADGESAFCQLRPEGAAGMRAAAAANGGAIPAFEPERLGIADARLAREMRARAIPMPLSAYETPAALAASNPRFDAIPRTYVLADEYAPSPFQRTVARHGIADDGASRPAHAPADSRARHAWSLVRLSTQHHIMLLKPRELAQAIHAVAASRQTRHRMSI
jgi:pimeloyl-ACP methyl ester carboxylesterase